MKTCLAAVPGAVLLCAFGAGLAQAATVTVTPYLSAADIPTGFYAGGPTFLEDFEDGTLDGGVTKSAGSVISAGAVDSVDGDDGVIDGSGLGGSSLFSGAGSAGILFTFSSVVTAAGLVWTDGLGLVTFEAFDGMGVSLGVTTASPAGPSTGGQTDEDTFFGITHAGGIKSIFIKNALGGIEVDHVQYGTMFVDPPPPPSAVPLPAAGLLLAGALGGLGMVRARRRT